MGLEKQLEVFLADFDIEWICQHAKREQGIEKSEVKYILDTFANETITTLSLIQDHLNSQLRILEIGAGICLFSLFLKSEGYNVVALEPALGGFSDFEKIKNSVLAYYAQSNLEVLEMVAKDLKKEIHGEFDFIFSNNVIEHIPDLSSTFVAMTNVLSLHGIMVHACPNYSIPYEPHFGIPVLKVWPGCSRWFFKKKIESNVDLWNSLNFISYFNVKTLATSNQLSVKFVRGVLYQNIVRLETDQQFKMRHRGTWIFSFFLILKYFRILQIIQYVPPWLSTPMIILLTREPKGSSTSF